MKFSPGSRRVSAATLIGLWLAGCGGGGGARAEASPNGPITSPSEPPPSASSSVVVYEDITSMELLKGPLDSSSWKTVAAYRRGEDAWSRLAQGRQLAVYRSASARNDAVTIYDLASGQIVLTQEIPKNTVVAGPVFGRADQYLLRTYVGASDGNQAFIVNLRAGHVLSTMPSGGGDMTIEALPDGRLYRIDSKTGVIAISAADGVWQTVGRLSIPAGTTIGNWRLNHQGTQIAVPYQWFTGASASRADVWIANIDGSGQYRLTHQGFMNLPVWSPDDARVGFNVDTTASLAGGGVGVTGKCSYWHVPVAARNVSGVAADQPHPVATQMRVNLHGVKNFGPCNVVAWEQ